MSKIINRITLITAFTSLALLCGCGSDSGKPSGNKSPSAKDSPSAMLRNVHCSGKSLSELSLTGANEEFIGFAPDNKPVTVVSLWAPKWFAGSDAQMKQLKELDKQMSPRGLRVICIAYDMKKDELKKAIADNDIKFEIGTIIPNDFSKLDVKALPTTWFLDSDGNLAATLEGYQPLAELTKTVDELCEKYGTDTPAAPKADTSKNDTASKDTSSKKLADDIVEPTPVSTL
ncbi:MAG: redoxin domain-containing protein [bacterium]|nr:redoxin domain-containing protein [bacterium]